MTKISNQYSLTNILTADLANSRLGINNVSPTVALDVTGAGKFSGALTVTGGIIASAANGNIRIKGSTDGFLGAGESDNKLYLTDWTTGAKGLTILLTTGAATFSSSVQIGSTLSNSLSVGLAAPTTDTLNQIFAGQGAFGAQAAGGETDIGNNWYYYSGFKYRITAPSSNIKLNGDVISFERAASGTANAAIPFAESMRITSGGNVGIGNTSPLKYLHIGPGSDAPINTNQGLYISNNGTTALVIRDSTNNSEFTIQTQSGSAILGTLTNSDLIFYTNNTARMTISTTGNIGAPSGTNIYNASDVRLKKNISTTTYGLDAISALNPVKFNWVDGFEPSEDGKDMLGFVAQEVQTVLPEAIESFGGNSITIGDAVIDNPLRVNEKFIIPVLVKAIQELSAKVSLLENK
jgi:hypothetical protein